MGSDLRDRGVWWGILRGRFVWLIVWLIEFAARAKKKMTAERRMIFFLTHTSYINLDFSQRHGKFHRQRT